MAEYQRLDKKEDVLRLIESFSEEFSTLTQRVELSAYAEKLAGHAEVIRMLDDAGNCIGMAAMYANDPVSRTAYISLIGIRNASQKAGYGQQLLGHCLDAARRAGMQKIRLEVDDDNEKARRFYAKNGFVQESVSQRNSRFLIRELGSGAD